MVTATARRRTPFTDFLPGQAFTGGVDWDWRMKKRYAIQGYWAGSTVRGYRGMRSSCCRRAPSTASSVPTPITSSWIRRGRRSTATPAGRVPEDRRIQSALQLERRLQDARTSTSTTSASCAAPTRIDEQLDAVAARHAVAATCAASASTSISGARGTSAATASISAATSTRTGCSPTTGRTGMGFNVNARTFDDRATRGVGPGAYGNPQPGATGAT